MAEDKPMTIKERMAALAKASGNASGAVPTPGPPARNASASPGPSVAERLAKMRRGGGDPNPHKTPDIVRPFTPPISSSASSTTTSAIISPSSSQATTGSSVAGRIALLGDSTSSSSQVPPSPVRAGSTFTPALARSASGGSNATDGADSAAGGQPTAESPTESPPIPELTKVLSADSSAGGATTGIKMRNSSRVSPGLAARMQAMKINPAAGSSSPIMGSGAGEGSGEREDPPPLPSSSTVPPIPVNRPPGISARLEALGALNPGKVEGNSDSAAGSGKGMVRPVRVGGMGLPGMGNAIPLPGLMPAGGLKELQRRKQAAGESGESKVVADCAAESTPEPGQLQHTVNLSRATMPQRRRPRKSARPFKPGPAAPAPAPAPSATELVAPEKTVTKEADVEVVVESINEPAAEQVSAAIDETPEVEREISPAMRLAIAAAAEGGGGGVAGEGDDDDDEDWN